MAKTVGECLRSMQFWGPWWFFWILGIIGAAIAAATAGTALVIAGFLIAVIGGFGFALLLICLRRG